MSYTGEGTIRLKSYAPMELKYTSSSKDSGLVVFSEIYYDDNWKATVDDKEVPVYNVDYCLRALILPAGFHEVIFKYDTSKFERSNKISFVLCLVVLLLIAFTFYMQRKEDNKSIN